MAKLSMYEAAEQYGVSRTTIFRAVKDGKLSAEKEKRRGRTVTVIDTSELRRVYGEPAVADNGASDVSRETPATELVSRLESEIEALKADKSDLRGERDRLLDIVASQQRLLTDERRPQGLLPWWRRVVLGKPADEGEQ
ncbi:MAG: hypothetical protein HN726_04545 [Candidatus Magasanikbacteria bacterium]|jgi:excisionase family DNA binding protein|nr:hypothetical protein [Candidatus Magasanikbacteria bacterium]